MKRIVRRIGLIFLIFFFVLALTVFAIVRWHLAPIVKQELQNAVTRSSHGLYALSIDKLRINVLTGNVRAYDVSLHTDTLQWQRLRRAQPADIPRKIDLTLASAGIFRIHWWNFYKTRELKLNRIEFSRPDIEVMVVKDSVLQREPPADTLTTGLLDRLPRLLAPHVASLHVESITVRNASFRLRTEQPGKQTVQSADSIYWRLSNLRLNPADTAADRRALYADNIYFDVRHYRLWTVGRRYLISIEQGRLMGKDSLLALRRFELRSVGSDSITYAEPRHRLPKFYLNVPEASVRGLDLFRALHRNEWAARAVQLDGAALRLFNNMDLPLPLNRPMPNEAWRRLKLPVSIDSLLVRGADIVYNETTDSEKGKLTFRNARLTGLNLSNDTTRMTDQNPFRLMAHAQFMGTGDLSVSLSMQLLSPVFACPYHATLRSMPLESLNLLIENKNNLRIEEGYASEASVRATATNGLTRGSVRIYYEGLKVSVLKEGSDQKRPLISALANLAIRNDSEVKKEGRSFRIAEIAYPRDPVDGFLRLLWRATQSGLVETLINVKVEPPKNDGRDPKELQKKARKRQRIAEAAAKKAEEARREAAKKAEETPPKDSLSKEGGRR